MDKRSILGGRRWSRSDRNRIRPGHNPSPAPNQGRTLMQLPKPDNSPFPLWTEPAWFVGGNVAAAWGWMSGLRGGCSAFDHVQRVLYIRVIV